MTQAHTPTEHQSLTKQNEVPTFYQQEQENPMTSPEPPEIHVEIDRKTIKISGEISWQQLRPMLKPIVLLMTHLTAAGIPWISTLQSQPNPPNPVPIEHHQSCNTQTPKK